MAATDDRDGVAAFIYAWGPLSGLHINPAVTLGFAARGAGRPVPHERAAAEGGALPLSS